MPTTYAHFRFGRDLLETLSPEVQRVIHVHQDLFHYGLHGPDLLFYYKPLGKNAVNQLGYACHGQTGREFFTRAAKTARLSPVRAESLSYLYGVLCHFALDRCCHPYIGRKEQEGVSHSAIESSFDRYLMVRDGLDPITHRVTGHLHPSEHYAAVIAPFYPPLTTREVFQAQKSMIFYLDTLVCHGWERTALTAAMKAAGQEKLQDMLIPYARNPRCADSDDILYEHYQEALSLCQTMLRELSACVRESGELGPGFDHTFGEE